MNMLGAVQRKLGSAFPALGCRDFRYFWVGQSLSLLGTWMQNIGQAWLVYTLTNSPFLLGLVTGLQFAPTLFLSLFAGVIADRFPKKKLLQITQATPMVVSLIMSVLVWTGSVRYWQILIMVSVVGIVNAIDMPVRQTYMIELVGKDKLMNAIALNVSVFNAARIIGPALAGLIMGVWGIAVCFFINALSYIPILYGLSKIRIEGKITTKNENTNVFGEIIEGISYAFHEPLLRVTLIIVAIISIFAMNFSILVPVMAKTVLSQGETGFGLLMSSMGIGSFIGAILMAAKGKKGPRLWMLFAFSFSIAILLVMIGLSTTFYMAAGFLAITGFFSSLFYTTANTTIQLNSENKYRNRVISLYTMLFAGTSPIGNLFAGSIAEKYGVGISYIAGGIAVLFCMTVLVIMKQNIRVNKYKYKEKGDENQS